MAKKKGVSVMAAVAAAEAQKQKPARDLPSLDGHIENLKILNGFLLKETVERRGQIEQLRSELAGLASENSILVGIDRDVIWCVLSSHFAQSAHSTKLLQRAEADLAAEQAAGVERAVALQIKMDLAAAELRASETRLLAVVHEKEGMERNLERTISERDLTQSDLSKKMKELAYLRERVSTLEQGLAQICVVRELAEAGRGKLEEEGKKREEMLRSVLHEKDSSESCLKEKNHLVEKLMRELEEVRTHKEAEMELLNAENEANALKVSALEEECRCLEEVRQKLENEVSALQGSLDEMKNEKVKWVAGFEEIEKKCVRTEEHLERSQIVCNLLEKEKLEMKMSFELKVGELTLQINELKGFIENIVVEKDLIDQRRTEYAMKISNLQKELLELLKDRKNLEDACRALGEASAIKEAKNIAAQRELSLKAEESVSLGLQAERLKESKNLVEQKHQQLQKELQGITSENEERKMHIYAVMVEKASLEKHLLAAQHGLCDIKKKLKASVLVSDQALSLLKKTTAEVTLGQEGPQENWVSRETGVEVEKGESLQPFLVELEAIKLTMKSRDKKIEEMNRGLELLQLSLADAQKNSRWGVCKWLCPAMTTIFAAVSLAYVCKGKLSSTFSSPLGESPFS